MENCSNCIKIFKITGGIVNFGGAIKISPISITNSTTDSGSGSDSRLTYKRSTNENSGMILPNTDSHFLQPQKRK